MNLTFDKGFEIKFLQTDSPSRLKKNNLKSETLFCDLFFQMKSDFSKVQDWKKLEYFEYNVNKVLK